MAFGDNVLCDNFPDKGDWEAADDGWELEGFDEVMEIFESR